MRMGWRQCTARGSFEALDIVGGGHLIQIHRGFGKRARVAVVDLAVALVFDLVTVREASIASGHELAQLVGHKGVIC